MSTEMNSAASVPNDASDGELSRMRAVTISRLYGSGGGEIATRLADRLGWQLIDHEVVARVATELGVPEQDAELRDEHVEGFVSRMLSNMSFAYPGSLIASPYSSASEALAYREALHRVVESAYRMGHVVIVGRGSQVLLHDHRDVLHLRIVASLPQRIGYVVRREGLSEHDARERIHEKDRDRARYLHAQYGQHPAEPSLYDLTLNTDTLTLDAAVELILDALRLKARQIALAPDQLGPGAGLPEYPGQAADLRTPESLLDERPTSE